MAERVFGLHSVGAVLARDPANVVELWVQRSRRDERLEGILRAARRAGVTVHPVERRVLDGLAPGQRHQGVVGSCRGLPALGEHDLEPLLDRLEGSAFLLILDSVQDPHNLGACLRSADAAGVHGVIAPKDRAAGLTPTVRKVASGAAESVPFVRVTNLARVLRGLRDRGLWIVGAAGEAEASLFETDLRGPLALVLGGEEKGLRRLTREHCDALARIPMLGRVESLNVSVAAGVCLFEALRQRQGG